MGKPTICALNGSAAGYGMDTALGCDIRIMAESAKMAAAFTKRGIVPESGGTWFLPRLIGWSKAAELIFTGRTLTADQCLEMGLASEVVPDADLAGAARALALEIAANAPLAVQASKRMMRMGLNETFNDHVHHVFLQLLPLLRSQDAAEGMRAFMEKRPASVHGAVGRLGARLDDWQVFDAEVQAISAQQGIPVRCRDHRQRSRTRSPHEGSRLCSSVRRARLLTTFRLTWNTQRGKPGNRSV